MFDAIQRLLPYVPLVAGNPGVCLIVYPAAETDVKRSASQPDLE